jgi:mannitol-specific phosphotransferase system IIBC component
MYLSYNRIHYDVIEYKKSKDVHTMCIPPMYTYLLPYIISYHLRVLVTHACGELVKTNTRITFFTRSVV